VLQGKRGALEELAREVAAEKKKEYEESRKRLKIDRESWFYERSIRGDSWVLYAEGKNIEESFSSWFASDEPFDLWLKQQMQEITGIDFNGSIPSGFPTRLFKYPSAFKYPP
jgi:hypothetical protein